MFGFAAARREIKDASKLTALDWELELKPRLPSPPANGERFQSLALNEAPEAAVGGAPSIIRAPLVLLP